MHFVVSGVVCPRWLPPVVAFLIALVTTPAGISGAFLLLPFQMSVLGFVGPAVTPTNLLYNVVAVPGGVVRYIREHRMVWPLAWLIAAGTLPGVFLGAIIRIHYLPNPRYAKVFVGCVLLYLGARLLLRRGTAPSPSRLGRAGHQIKFQCQGESYSFSATALVIPYCVTRGRCGGRNLRNRRRGHDRPLSDDDPRATCLRRRGRCIIRHTGHLHRWRGRLCRRLRAAGLGARSSIRVRRSRRQLLRRSPAEAPSGALDSPFPRLPGDRSGHELHRSVFHSRE